MGEIPVHREGFAYSESIHDDEAQAVDEAVVLVLVPGKVRERRLLVVDRRVMHLAEDLSKQLPAHADGQLVPGVRIMARPLAE
jgi:hypothetical protein